MSHILFSITGMLVGTEDSRSYTFYFRIPIAPDRPIEVSIFPDLLVAALICVQDNYLDAYLRVIRTTDPLRTALVFSCGMGAVRTTFAMVAASIVRRKQLLVRGFADPYAMKGNAGGTPMSIGTPTSVVGFLFFFFGVQYPTLSSLQVRKRRPEYYRPLSKPAHSRI